MSRKIDIPENCKFIDSKRLYIKGFNNKNLEHIYNILSNEIDKNINHNVGRHTFFIEISPYNITEQYFNISKLLNNLTTLYLNNNKLRVIFLTLGNTTYKDFAHLFDNMYNHTKIQGIRRINAPLTKNISSKEYCDLINKLIVEMYVSIVKSYINRM